MDAYGYDADHYCESCAIEALIAEGRAAPAAREMPIADVIDQIVEVEALTWEAESTEHVPQWCSQDECLAACCSCGALLDTTWGPDEVDYAASMITESALRARRGEQRYVNVDFTDELAEHLQWCIGDRASDRALRMWELARRLYLVA